MTNLVEITVKATGPASSDWTKIKADAAKAGREAGDAFNAAFKPKADATISEKLKETGGLSGSDDRSIIQRMKAYSSTPGGIGLIGTGNDSSLLNMLKSQIRAAGQNGSMGLVGGQQTSELVRQSLANNVTGNTTSTDLVKQILENNVTGNMTTKDFVNQVLVGNSPGNISTTDTIREKILNTGISDQGKKDGDTYGKSFAASLMSRLSGVLSGKGGKGGGGGGALSAVSGALDSGGVAGGALPGISGVSGMAATVTGLGAALIAVLPAITSVLGGLTAIGGGFAILMETNAKFASNIDSTFSGMEKTLGQDAAPLVKPLESAFSQLGGFLKQISPLLTDMFKDAGPLIQPLLNGLKGMVSGALPGFLAMIKAAGPVFQALAPAFTTFGKDLGTMFKDFASDGGGSATILKSFLDIISSLLPVIGTLGKIFVSALAPAFAAFGSALTAVLPALTPLFNILGQFAGAVLTDLAGVLKPIGTLLIGLAPSFKTLASVAGTLFNTLENAGVFAILADALEQIAPPLAKMINGLVQGLAPALPPIIKAVGQVASLLAGQLGAALTDILVALTPVITFVAKLVAGIVTWLSKSGLLVPVIIAIAAAIDPAGVAIAGLGLLVSELVTHWSQWWGDIEKVIKTVWNDILSFAKQWWPLLLGVGGIIYKYHEQIWDFIQQIWNKILDFLKNLWKNIESTAVNAWSTVYNGVVNAWTNIVNWFTGVPAKILKAVGKAGTVLYDWGKGVINGMLSGFGSIWNTVKNFFTGLPKKILGWLGIHSPPDWAIQAGKDIMNGLGIGMNQAQSAASNAASAAAAAQAAAMSGGISSAGVSNASAEMALASAANKMGWGGSQWAALYDVEMREAGFSLTATNPSSGAYGMAQFINGPSEYAQYGGNVNTAAGQATAMVNYIAQRYGNPQNAWNHELAYGWYDQGGWLSPGYTLAYNGTGSPERVGGSGNMVVTLCIEAGDSDASEFIATMLKKYVRVKGGGNVQTAFGRH